MFCCAPPNIRKWLFLSNGNKTGYEKLRAEQSICIVSIDANSRRSRNYLPKFTEHKIQEEPGFVIDDPSSIFYDPDEKAGFVYHSLPGNTDDIEADDILAPADKSLDSSIDFDDSLDLISNIPTTSSVKEASFDRGYDINSRRLSNTEQDAGYSADEATYHSYNVDVDKTPVNLLLSSDHRNPAPELSNLRIYEDSGYSSGGQRHRKDNYNSDAESTNKYQDSGIYEDDVFSDSPKHVSDIKLSDDGFLHDHELEMDDFIPEQTERLSAFKTPSSSPQKLETGLNLSRISGKKLPSKGRLNRFLQAERDSRQIITNGVEQICGETQTIKCPCNSSLLHGRTNASKSNVQKSSSKYSHVQAKVQTRRKSATSPGRAISPGKVTPPRKSTSPSTRKSSTTQSSRQRKTNDVTYKPLNFGRPTIENKKLEFKKKARSKVGSLENVGHTPGGGQTKVFNQKLEFRKHAGPRTDTHGVEMYSNLPEEFQEIARRLARQDHQLKLGTRQGNRGRARSRSSSTIASSRASSVSPTRGRSQTRRPPTPSLPLQQKTTYRSSSPSRLGCLSRSSSIRSIPTTPNLHSKHPATSSILYDKKTRSRPGSPSSRPHSPNASRSYCSSRAGSPIESRSRPRSKSRSRPGTPKSGDSQATTPIRQLYQFSQSNSFIPGSPKIPGSQPVFQFVPVR